MLKAYVDNFGADFVALRGTPEETQAVAKAFKVFYAKVPGKTEGSYTMDHTAGSYVFDAAGPGAPVHALRHRRRGADARPASCCWPSRAEAQRRSGPAAGGRCGRLRAAGRRRPQARLPSALRIFFSAATSIWRMRSALTPYSAASSCSVMPPEASSLTFSQRSSTMRRLRASSASSACAMPSPASQSRWRASSARVGSLRVVGQVGDRRVALLAVVGLRLQRHVAAGQARLHLDHFVGLDVQLARHRVDLGRRQRVAVRVGVERRRSFMPCFIERRLKNSLRCALVVATLTMRQFFRMYSWISALIQCMRVAHQAHALLGVEALDGLHQADIAFLDQVALRQAVAQVLARDRHHQAQVRQHQPPGGLQVARRRAGVRAKSQSPPACVSMGRRLTAEM